ncbi:MAG: hypothetical protein LDL11_01515 [Desulfarculus sp.]|nr:hypothetical protein [Desulfarculus sp.]
MPLEKKQLIALMEGLPAGSELVYQLSPTFGGNYVVIVNDPNAKKRYTMRWGKSLEVAKSSEPFIAADKAKKIAEWVAERNPSPVE